MELEGGREIAERGRERDRGKRERPERRRGGLLLSVAVLESRGGRGRGREAQKGK